MSQTGDLPAGQPDEGTPEPGAPASGALPPEAGRLLRLVIDHLPGWLALVTLDGRYLIANQKYTETFQRPLDAIEGHPYLEVTGELGERHRPLLEACAGGATVPFDEVLVDAQGQRIHAHGVYRPIRGDDGQVQYLSAYALDITDRVRVEEARQRSDARLAVTLRSIGDSVVAVDDQERVVLLNQAAERLLDLRPQEAQGRPLAEVVPLRPVFPDGHELVRRDGTTLPVEIRSSPVPDPGGGPGGRVLVLRDLTAQRQREADRIQAQKLEALGLLAGGIAHDFNNLLTSILGNVSLAQSRAGLPAAAHADLQRTLDASQRATGLTRQLLTFARGGAPVRQLTDLRRPIREAAAFASAGSQARCRITVARDLWPAEVDEGQLARVVQNLVLNGLEAMDGQGELDVSAGNLQLADGDSRGLPPGPYLQLQVIDRGSGIPDAARPHLFDPYYTTKERRSGLGLAISHSIVQRHAGWIGVAATSPAGTTLEVLLPARPEAPRPQPAPGRTLTTPQSGRALVMDDEPEVLEFLSSALARIGWQVVPVLDGAAAVRAFAAERAAGRPLDAVILDLTVPGGLGGVETLRQLRQLDPDVWAVVTSGYCADPVLANPAGYGFAAVLPKPFRVEALASLLTQAVARR
ncbi:MAG: PAS domain-containing protein [Myxococcota bacterium]|jgi:PAS domain S-box-containing protein|nr:PAS domain-containing protein [Myxococcota bacterium]